ncbi:unnamed protein product [Brassica rapa subsp. narinosa]
MLLENYEEYARHARLTRVSMLNQNLSSKQELSQSQQRL